MGYLVTGLPNTGFGRTVEGNDFFSVETGLANTSVSTLITGNVAGQIFITPSSADSFIIVKGITILGDGNQGKVYVKRSVGNKVLLPTYFSAQNRAGTSSALNIVLNVGENVIIDTIDRGTSETFIGVTYIEVKSLKYEH